MSTDLEDLADPIDSPCFECGAEPHEPCRPMCIGHDEMDE